MIKLSEYIKDEWKTKEIVQSNNSKLDEGLLRLILEPLGIYFISKWLANFLEKIADYQDGFNSKLIKAQKQIVAGVNYFLTVKIKPENCQNDCDIETCEMTIWEKPWENFTEMTEFNCKREHSLFGSNIRIDNNDKFALKALEYAVNQLNNESNDMYKYKLDSVDKIYRQVVNGMKYTFVFKMVKTECAKNTKDARLLSECPVGKNPQIKNVKVSVLDKPWIQGN